MYSRCVIVFASVIAACECGLIPASEVLTPTYKVSSIVHNAPSAISHQSFTRIHNQPQLQHIQSPTVQAYVASAPVYAQPPVPVVQSVHLQAPVVKTLTHTPAHLTYAASPVVYKMLPMIKPVRSISYDSLLPRPRNYGYSH